MSFIPSLIGGGGLWINPSADSDLSIGTMNRDKSCQAIHFRLHAMSRFEGWMQKTNAHRFFMMMYKNEKLPSYGIHPNEALSLLKDEKEADVISFASDEPRGYLSIIKTKDNIIGVQTYHANWQDMRGDVTPVWLGRCDVSTESAKNLTDFYQECDELFAKWPQRGKAITKKTTTIGQLINPIIPE